MARTVAGQIAETSAAGSGDDHGCPSVFCRGIAVDGLSIFRSCTGRRRSTRIGRDVVTGHRRPAGAMIRRIAWQA